MGSSEIVASGRVRSGFSLTCNRLSRYLKEKKGSFADIGLVLTPRENIMLESKGTMNLLPMIDKSCDQVQDEIHDVRDSVIEHEAAKSAQMTIFYGGRVMLFDNLPAEKANEIIEFASKASASASRAVEQRERDCYPLRLSLDDSGIESVYGLGIRLLADDLPIARERSLSRFLEKRKGRVTANAPYPMVKAD